MFMVGYHLTQSQRRAFDAFTSGTNMFLTGKGGTGKSFLVERIKEWAEERDLKVISCAPTGVAALNIHGETIHKVLGCGIGIMSPTEVCHNKERLEILEKADMIIMDEVSMCRADLFSVFANTILGVWRKRGKPFRLLFVGDFYQLPPVLSRSEEDAYASYYADRLFAFETEQWDELGLKTYELTEQVRQTERAFIESLDNIREGVADFSALKACCRKSFDSESITLCGRNKEASDINWRKLMELTKDPLLIEGEVTGDFRENDYLVERELYLAPGAKVMMLNNDPLGNWVNGTIGQVERFVMTEGELTSILVKLVSGKTVEVAPVKYTAFYYKTSRKEGKFKIDRVEVSSITQYPMKLSWAISIHKSQGQTFDKVNLNIDSIFSAGQLYVALSRCRTLHGLTIKGALTPEKVMANPKVVAFMKRPVERELFW